MTLQSGSTGFVKKNKLILTDTLCVEETFQGAHLLQPSPPWLGPAHVRGLPGRSTHNRCRIEIDQSEPEPGAVAPLSCAADAGLASAVFVGMNFLTPV
jgi:hypothetical protein